MFVGLFATGGLVLAGCRGIQTSGEKQARQDFRAIAS